ncbi:hypothetical protein LIA77_07737 [Sarocladium implicatum]|nr:hypothetical protein LIA77_07737 [Sarocladium implicatum]
MQPLNHGFFVNTAHPALLQLPSSPSRSQLCPLNTFVAIAELLHTRINKTQSRSNTSDKSSLPAKLSLSSDQTTMSSANSVPEHVAAVETTPTWVQEALTDAQNDARERPWRNSIKEAPQDQGMTDKPDVVIVKDDLTMMMSTLAA